MIANTIGADMDAEQLQELYQLARAAHAITDFEIKARALLARQPAAIDNEADDDIEEAREILENMVRSIELDGNYSTEATCTFLRQALNCLPVAAPLANEASKTAAKESPKETMERLTRQFNQISELERAVICDFIKRAAPSVEQDERGAFEASFKAWTGQSISFDKVTDDEGDERYADEWLQGAWIGWQARAASTSANVQDERGALPLSDFREGQWWISELDAWAETGSDDQKRAVAVVHRLLRAVRAASTSANVAQGAEAVVNALEETQGLLVAMLHEKRSTQEIEQQIGDNRTALQAFASAALTAAQSASGDKS
jgi:hypothetical protein